METIDVLCVGATSWDLVFEVERHPEKNEKTVARTFLSCGGGPAANAAVTVAALGLTCAFAGYLGEDSFGVLHLEELNRAGVDTRWIRRGHAPTPLSTAWVKPDGSRALVNYRDKGAALPANCVDLAKIKPGIILFDGHEPEVSEVILNQAGNQKIKTILDAGSVNPGTEFLYDKVDYLVCSRKFSRDITGESAPESALQALYRINRCVIITLGGKGLIWKTKTGQGHLPAMPVAVQDTTGAGDVFHGAFAACMARDLGFEAALGYAGGAAALSCTKIGARSAIPDKKQVDHYLSNINHWKRNQHDPGH